MRKFLSIFLFLILSISLTSCSAKNAKFINFSSKPSNHFYSDELLSKILNNEDYTVALFDTNLYKEIIVDKDENYIIENFLTSLTNENYVDEPLTKKEPYRLKITFEDNNKYIIRVYDSTLISISPWDGNYPEDIISMDKLPLRYNLLDFCKHIQNKPISK